MVRLVKRIIFMFIMCAAIIGYMPRSAQASIIKTPDLQTLCAEIEKGQIGAVYDAQSAAKCQGYLAGFFDTMIILEEMKKYRYFCIPDTVSKEANTRIIDEWVKSNPDLAQTTTAAVALLSAYQKAFPCAENKQKQKVIGQ